jgi:DNA-binding IclR family transcriptional regulator
VTRPRPAAPLSALIAGRLRVHDAMTIRELARTLKRTRAETETMIRAMADDGTVEPDPGTSRWRLR